MATEQKLNQVLAVEKGLKDRVEKELTARYHALQKPALFDGMMRIYRPLKEDGERVPPEHRRVQQNAHVLLDEATKRLGELFDITATKDWANCNAKADVIVDGETILQAVPATFLLFLEKQLVNVHTLIEKMPALDPAETWTKDVNDGSYKAALQEKIKTAKVQRPIVLYQATDKHPAQTQLINEDITVGYWEEQRVSGAYPATEQKRLLAKVEKLQAALKRAREQANVVSAPNQEVGGKIFGWLFK